MLLKQKGQTEEVLNQTFRRTLLIYVVHKICLNDWGNSGLWMKNPTSRVIDRHH